MNDHRSRRGYRQLLGRDARSEFVLGRPRTHLLVVGPSQAGKSSSLLAPAALRAPGALVTSSTKEELAQVCRGRRPGTSWWYEPMGHTGAPEGLRVLRFSPLSLISRFEEALLWSRILMDTAFSYAGAGVTNETYWVRRGSMLLAALLWAAVRGDRPIGEVFRWVSSQDTVSPIEVLGEQDGEARAILAGLGLPVGHPASIGKPVPREAGTVFAFAQTAVAAYAYPAAQRLADDPNFRPSEFVATADTVHVVCPSQWAAEAGPPIATIISAIAEAQYQRHAQALRTGDAVLTPTSLVLDEVANTAALPGLPGLTSEGAGQGLLLVLGAQDRAQLGQRWGTDQARTIVNNCRDKVVLGELGDREFLEDMEKLAGMRWEYSTAAGITETGEGPTSTLTTTPEPVPAWRAWEVAQLRPYTALYLEGWRPQLIDLVRWSDMLRANPPA